ncbi:MAG: thiolase family protein, partial [Solirubrobacteraceae bacterium]
MRERDGREVVIVEAVRTPIGRGHREKGYYKDTHPADLLGKTYSEVISRAGIDASEVGDVIAGCVQEFGEQGFNIARNAWLQEGLPIETPATTIDRQCGSAQQAVNFGATLIAAGVHDVVIGSGV